MWSIGRVQVPYLSSSIDQLNECQENASFDDSAAASVLLWAPCSLLTTFLLCIAHETVGGRQYVNMVFAAAVPFTG